MASSTTSHKPSEARTSLPRGEPRARARAAVAPRRAAHARAARHARRGMRGGPANSYHRSHAHGVWHAGHAHRSRARGAPSVLRADRVRLELGLCRDAEPLQVAVAKGTGDGEVPLHAPAARKDDAPSRRLEERHAGQGRERREW
eukprot:7378049-Prymnesium_polylepis.1